MKQAILVWLRPGREGGVPRFFAMSKRPWAALSVPSARETTAMAFWAPLAL